MTEDEKLKRHVAGLEDRRDIPGEDAVLAPAKAVSQRSANLNAAKCHTLRSEHGEMRSRFVGRKAEFQAIKRRIESLTEGHGRIVSLIGEAGVGKSRLVAEVRKHVCGSTTDFPVQWLEGSAAVSMGRVASYGPFCRIIGRYAGIAEQDDKSDPWDKLQSRLTALFGERSTEIFPYLATMMALHLPDDCVERVNCLSSETICLEIFRATEQLFESIAGTQPLVLVLEDLQWIDESSVALLQHLLPLIYRTPLLILGVGRPTVETAPVKLRDVMATVYHNRYDEIRLSPLSPYESERLVANLLGDESHALLLTDKILEKAGGNPFSIEKTIQSLIHVDYGNPRSYIPEHLVDKILAGRSAIQGQRRLVTVMSAEVAEYASISHKLDPEEVRGIMNGCFRILMDEVHECEGTVNEFRRDGIMALFGASIACEDHAQRACYAGVAIHKALVPFRTNLKTRFGIDIEVRIGLNTCIVAVGAIRDDLSMDFTAQGDSTNIASAIEGRVERGAVVVSEQTYRFAKNFFEFEPLEELRIKGREHPVKAYRLIDKACTATERSEREMCSEMIGRDRELSKLELQVLKAFNSEGSVVNVIGQAGIGKSRLLAELKKRDVSKRALFLEGRAISIGKNLSFHPIIDLLSNWALIREADEDTAASGKLESAVRAVCSDEADEIFPFVATMMSLKLTGKHTDRVRGIAGEPLEKLIFKNVRDLLTGLTRISTIVILMEDLHWADASSLLLLQSLYRLALTRRIVFINVFRPGYWESDDGTVENLKAREPAFPLVKIRLQPLDPNTSEALIDNILNIKGLQYGVKGQIIERAGGNPYFIEEIVRSLIDEGAVKTIDGGFEVTEKIDCAVIPSTINEALMARIDRLDEENRHVLKVASVIGRSFFHRILADVMGPMDGLDDKMAHLKQIQLIREQRWMDELEYSFHHALAQEAVYESVPYQRRKELHLKVAKSTERTFSARLHEFYGTLAYHYGGAEDTEKAEEFLLKAGEKALKSAASNEALRYYLEALSIYRKLRGANVDPAKVAMLEKNIGLALFNRGRYAEAVQHFDEALNYYWEELPGNGVSQAFRFLSGFVALILSLYFPSLYFRRIPANRDIQAEELIAKKLEVLSTIDAKRYFIEFFYYLTIVRFDYTKFHLGWGGFAGIAGLFIYTGLSLSIGRRILDFAKPKLDPHDAEQWLRYDLLDTEHHLIKGEWKEIAEYDEDLVNRTLRMGKVWDATQHYFWHGVANVYQGHFDAAKLMVSKLDELADAYENDVCYFLKYHLNIDLLIQRRNLKEAIDELNRGIDLARRSRSVLLFAMYSQEVWIHLLMKETKEAGKALDQADRIRSEAKYIPIQLSAFYRNQFEYYLQRLAGSLGNGHDQESYEHRRNALKSGKALIKSCRKAPMFRMDYYRLVGVYHWLIHDQKGAFKWWQKAIAEGERLGARPQLARTYAEMAVRTLAARDEFRGPVGRTAEMYLEKAKAMFIEMDLRHDLEDLNFAIR